jgi:Holliday junction resolvase
MKEQDLVNAILDFLRVNGAWAIRVNSGGKQVENEKGKRHFIRMAPAGTPDILACWPGGLLLAVEVKVPGNKPTALQLATLEAIRQAGGLAVVAYSIDNVKEAIEEVYRRSPCGSVD